MRVAVVVGRFQVPTLSSGHMSLIQDAARGSDALVVVLGSASKQLDSHDPLDFITRSKYLHTFIPSALILELKDHPDDVVWSENLDRLVRNYFPYPGVEFILFQGKEDTLEKYTGKFRIVKVISNKTAAGTEFRARVVSRDTEDFRAGMVYAGKSRYPTSYQAVDIAVHKKGHILVGRKSTDSKGLWRLPGGMVDPSDASLEHAALRELREECGFIETTRPEYLTSLRIDDWRYRNSPDKIMSALFVCEYVFGATKAGDDLEEVAFIPIANLENVINPIHRPLLSAALEYFKETK